MGRANKRNDDIYEMIATNIKYNRKHANLTQAELADITGFYFSIDTLVQIAKALDIKMEDLFEGIDNINLDENINKKNIQ